MAFIMALCPHVRKVKFAAQGRSCKELRGESSASYLMKTERKITIHVPEDLLKRAKKATKSGTTETVRQGLQLIAASGAYSTLLGMQGKIKFSIPIKKLREDRK